MVTDPLLQAWGLHDGGAPDTAVARAPLWAAGSLEHTLKTMAPAAWKAVHVRIHTREQPTKTFMASSSPDMELGQGSLNLAVPRIHCLENFWKHIILGLTSKEMEDNLTWWEDVLLTPLVLRTKQAAEGHADPRSHGSLMELHVRTPCCRCKRGAGENSSDNPIQRIT